MHSFDAADFAGEQRRHCTGMPASDPSDETGIMEMADNAAAEKPGAAKYSHVQRHEAKVSPRLRLSHSNSTARQTQHRAGASQTAFASAAPAPTSAGASGETGQSLTIYDHYVAHLADIFDILALASRVSHA